MSQFDLSARSTLLCDTECKSSRCFARDRPCGRSRGCATAYSASASGTAKNSIRATMTAAPITSAGRFSPLGPRGMRLSRLFLSSSRNDNDAVGDGQVGGINPTLDLFFRQSRNLRRDHTYGVAFRGRVNPILKGIIRFKNSKNCHIPSPRYFRPSVSRLRQGRDGPSRRDVAHRRGANY